MDHSLRQRRTTSKTTSSSSRSISNGSSGSYDLNAMFNHIDRAAGVYNPLIPTQAPGVREMLYGNNEGDDESDDGNYAALERSDESDSKRLRKSVEARIIDKDDFMVLKSTSKHILVAPSSREYQASALDGDATMLDGAGSPTEYQNLMRPHWDSEVKRLMAMGPRASDCKVSTSVPVYDANFSTVYIPSSSSSSSSSSLLEEEVYKRAGIVSSSGNSNSDDRYASFQSIETVNNDDMNKSSNGSSSSGSSSITNNNNISLKRIVRNKMLNPTAAPADSRRKSLQQEEQALSDLKDNRQQHRFPFNSTLRNEEVLVLSLAHPLFVKNHELLRPFIKSVEHFYRPRWFTLRNKSDTSSNSSNSKIVPSIIKLSIERCRKQEISQSILNSSSINNASLSVAHGSFLIIEYVEERPPLLQNFGMISKIINYTRRHREEFSTGVSMESDNSKNSNNSKSNSKSNSSSSNHSARASNVVMAKSSHLPAHVKAILKHNFDNVSKVSPLGNIKKLKVGDSISIDPDDPSPFLFGELKEGETVSTVVNKLFRVPVFKHAPDPNVFLLVHRKDQLLSSTNKSDSNSNSNSNNKTEESLEQEFKLRRISMSFLAGQMEPKVRVPSSVGEGDDNGGDDASSGDAAAILSVCRLVLLRGFKDLLEALSLEDDNSVHARSFRAYRNGVSLSDVKRWLGSSSSCGSLLGDEVLKANVLLYSTYKPSTKTYYPSEELLFPEGRRTKKYSYSSTSLSSTSSLSSSPSLADAGNSSHDDLCTLTGESFTPEDICIYKSALLSKYRLEKNHITKEIDLVNLKKYLIITQHDIKALELTLAGVLLQKDHKRIHSPSELAKTIQKYSETETVLRSLIRKLYRRSIITKFMASRLAYSSWNITKSYYDCVIDPIKKTRLKMSVSGDGDPSALGDAISYIPEATVGKKSAMKIEGTDNDLRHLNLAKLEYILCECFGEKREEVRKLDRWKQVARIEHLCSVAQDAKVQAKVVSQFSRLDGLFGKDLADVRYMKSIEDCWRNQLNSLSSNSKNNVSKNSVSNSRASFKSSTNLSLSSSLSSSSLSHSSSNKANSSFPADKFAHINHTIDANLKTLTASIRSRPTEEPIVTQRSKRQRDHKNAPAVRSVVQDGQSSSSSGNDEQICLFGKSISEAAACYITARFSTTNTTYSRENINRKAIRTVKRILTQDNRVKILVNYKIV